MAITLTNSRFITHPSLEEKTTSHTVVIVNPTDEEITAIGTFCQTCNKNYDIYLYSNATNDSAWYTAIVDVADHVIESNPLEYFQNIDNQT